MAFFKLEGTLSNIEGGTWNIGGLLIEKVNSSQAIPPVGSRVKIKGLVQGDRIFLSKIEDDLPPKNGASLVLDWRLKKKGAINGQEGLAGSEYSMMMDRLGGLYPLFLHGRDLVSFELRVLTRHNCGIYFDYSINRR